MKKDHDIGIIPFSVAQNSMEGYLFRITVKSKAIYWSVTLLVFFVLASLPFIYVDVSVNVTGYFQPPLEKQTIFTISDGKVTFTSIMEGKHVNYGDTLLMLDSEPIKAQALAINNQIEENLSSIYDLEILTGAKSEDLAKCLKKLSMDRYEAELGNFLKQMSIQTWKTRKAKTEFERNEILYNQETIPSAEYENSLYVYTIEKETQIGLQLKQKSLWQSDLTQRKENAINLHAEYKKCLEDVNNRVITAPLCGEIIQSADIQKGTILNATQQIAIISPDGEMVAICFVSPKDIGLLHEKQEIRLRVDAFNYNEWGILPGYISKISNDIIVDNNSTPYFMVECKPQREYLVLKNGFKGYLKKGMTFSAGIIVTRRNLFNLLFDKADKWFNPYSKT